MIISSVFGFVSGIAFGSFVYPNLWLFLSLFFVVSVIFFYRYSLEEKNRLFITIISLFLVTFLVGFLRVSISPLYKDSALNSYANKSIQVEGIVVSEPDVRETNTKLTIEIQKITEENQVISVKEKILVTSPIYPEFKYGDRLKLELKLEKPKNFDTGDGRVFDYVGYLRARGIWYVARYGKLELMSHNEGNFVKSNLFKIKNTFKNSISSALPEPESSLLNGILLGAKQSLGEDLLKEFQRTGTSHIVVLSGYNIAIVSDSVMNVLSPFSKNISIGFGIVSVVLFTILSGGSASAVRASIMVIVALFAKRFNRDYKAGRALGFTVVFLLAPNPLLLAFDPSFQLSVLATIGLVFVTPIVSSHLKFITEKFSLREIISGTIGAQVTTLPLLLYNTGIFSLVSLPVNILVLGTIPIVMFFGFFTGMFGLVSLYLSFIPAFFSYILLRYELFVIHIGSNLLYGAINIPEFSVLYLFAIYSGIFIGLYYLKNR